MIPVALPLDLSRLTAQELRTALIIANRPGTRNRSEEQRIRREIGRRGIRVSDLMKGRNA